ncbi:MAG TPA: HAMP domain-containing sensor histidine kinase [Terriglobales bacterium]|jgi:signal transduction histidine kinase
MRINGRRRRAVVFIVLGAVLAALAAAFNIGWILLNWREGALLIVGVFLFPLIVAGLVLNTVFLVREIRRNEQHNAFINAVTHELKTPVASIRLYLEMLQSRPIGAEQSQEFYRVMLADSDRLLATVEQILRTGRTGHALRSIEQQSIALPELAAACIALVVGRYGLAADVIQLQVEEGAARAVVAGDADELRAALSNLLDNAVKYSGRSAQPLRVEVRLQGEDPKYWTVRVRDNGVGIAAPELKAIFKRFYRVPNQAVPVSGTGLGLFIVRSVVRRHGGRVAAESHGLGQGSTFIVQLPRATA